ncbi:hypothetical protein ABR763_01070 [Bacillus cereus]
MALIYGYCYDDQGRFTEQIPLEEKPIYDKQTFYREETKEVIDEEGNISIETIKVPYEEDVIVGYEPDVPPNCTLVPSKYTDATWDGTKWIYDRDNIVEEPNTPEDKPYPHVSDLSLFAYETSLKFDRQERLISILQDQVGALQTRVNELEIGVSSRRDVPKEPMNPEDLPNYTPSEEPPEPKQDLLALYLDPSVGKE